MPDFAHLSLFAGAALIILIIPGPTVVYIVTRSLHQGRRAGLLSVAGTTTGLLVHVAASVAGMSAILLSSAIAFRVLKFAGAAYFIVLGIMALRNRHASTTEPALRDRSKKRLFIDGMVINAFNPKPALFFTAFLPQFVDSSKGSPTLQLLALGLTFCALALISDGTYALLAGTVAKKVRHRGNRMGNARRYARAATYFGLGAYAAVSGDHPA